MLKGTHIILIFSCILSTLLSSCEKEDYVNSIPRNCVAIIGTPTSTFDISIKGIDSTQQVYVFETSDGTLGLCAPVKDEYVLEGYLHNLEKEGKADNFTEYEGKSFCTMSGVWVAGYNNSTLLIMGPVIPSERSKMTKRISRYLEQQEEASIKQSDIWQHLNTCFDQDKEISQVAINVSALPESLSAYFTLGVPKGTTPEDLILEGTITTDLNDLQISGHTCSYNPNVKQQLQKNQRTMFRPITFDWNKSVDSCAIVNVCMNVDGKELLSNIHNNKTLNTLLLGSDVYDKLKETDGNIVISMNRVKHADEFKYEATMNCIQDKKLSTKEGRGNRLVVTIDINALTDGLGKSIIPLLGDIKQIKYILTE